jgi:3-oxoacyl-[acyl-carrier-protein] synthase-3
MRGINEQSGGTRVCGVGGYRPARVVFNKEISAAIDSTDEWIQQRSGITSRRFAGPDETIVSMAVAAGQDALAHAGVAPDRVGAVLVATMSNLRQSPTAAPEVAHRLGAPAAAAFDLGAACAGFCYGVAIADSLIRSGTAEYVLVIGSERMSDIVDPRDRSTAFLFGDGAGAVLVGPSTQPEIGPVVWGSDGAAHDLIGHTDSWASLRDGTGSWPTLRMAGPEVFRWALREVPPVARAAVVNAGLTVSDLAAFVPHQANMRIIDRVAQSLELPPSVVIARDIETTGNTVAASVPLALHALLENAAAPQGNALLTGFGAGLTYAALVIRLPAPR